MRGDRLWHAACRGPDARQYSWELVNGFWSLFLAFGLTLTALLTRTAHRWSFGNSTTRQLITDYGAPLMVSFGILATLDVPPKSGNLLQQAMHCCLDDSIVWAHALLLLHGQMTKQLDRPFARGCYPTHVPLMPS